MMRAARVGDTTAGFSHRGSETSFFRHFYPPAEQKMQRLLVALCLGGASAFAPQQLTQNSLVKLQANPIDIYSTATVRNYDFACSWERQQLDDVALPIF